MATDYYQIGFLAYPRTFGKPKAGTPEEIEWSRGWQRAQMLENVSRTGFEMEEPNGRNNFLGEYLDETRPLSF